MTSRERVIAAIEFAGPDRVPHRHAVLPAAWAAYPQLPELLARCPSDLEGDSGMPPARLSRAFARGRYTDEWGCTWTVPHHLDREQVCRRQHGPVRPQERRPRHAFAPPRSRLDAMNLQDPGNR